MKNHKRPKITIKFTEEYTPIVCCKNCTQQDVFTTVSKLTVQGKTMPRIRKTSTLKRFKKAIKYACSRTPADKRGKYCKGGN